ncbi:hypothetical protein AAFP30_09525 [Gordonia sp. CPCC 205515]|uniref:hypothetical protein n=1 Tax=Gordonia sp. CPCC 205515 TaxID=3140791 RepID=UPI003AF3CAF3
MAPRSLRTLTVITLCIVGFATIGTPAATAAPDRPATSTTSSKKSGPESYTERQDRIAKSKRPLLRPLDENRGKQITCVSGEFVTLTVVYDSIFESLLPSIPASLRPAAEQQRAAAHRDMSRLNVSTLAVSDSPFALGADADDPAVKYRTPISQWLVVQLLKIRDGKQDEAIPVGNLTLVQAVETAWLYIFAGVLAPLQVGLGMTPALGSPFDDTTLSSLSGYVTYNSILQIFLLLSNLGLQQLYSQTAGALLNRCVAQVSDAQRDQAGKADANAALHIPIAPIIADIAGQLALADGKSCTPVGSLSLQRIVQRTSDYAQSTVNDAATKSRIRAETGRLLAGMRSVAIPLNLIPADPSDLTSAESWAALIGGQIPYYLGGAPLNIAIGLSHNITQGDNLAATVPLADLTVTKSLTAAYYAYHLSQYLFSTIGGLAQGQILSAAGIETKFSPVGIASALLGLPLTFGLVTYHHVLRSMCLREDDTTGSGVGAQGKKAPVSVDKSDSTTSSRPTRVTPQR